jgi:singapore isolate B (sub-type 7) whole genome shotgun sequence assembly, scaffold_1
MGYVPKQGKMTIEDVEQELEMLAKRMEFLGQTLQELKKENAKNM